MYNVILFLHKYIHIHIYMETIAVLFPPFQWYSVCMYLVNERRNLGSWKKKTRSLCIIKDFLLFSFLNSVPCYKSQAQACKPISHDMLLYFISFSFSLFLFLHYVSMYVCTAKNIVWQPFDHDHFHLQVYHVITTNYHDLSMDTLCLCIFMYIQKEN